MPFATKTGGPVLYVSWRGFTVSDLDAVTAQVTELRRAVGADIVYVARLPGDGRVFSDDDHAVLLRFLLTILPSCASIHHVVEGDGFLKSARHAIVTNMAHATPRPRDFHAHATIAEAAAFIMHATGVDVRELARGDSTPPSSGVPSSGVVDVTPEDERASSAFRAAARIAVDSRRRPRD